MLASLVASVTSPAGKGIGIGPFQLGAYGATIVVGVLVAVRIAQRRYARRGGEPEAVTAVAMWTVPIELDHVITDYQRFQGRLVARVGGAEGGLGSRAGGRRRRVRGAVPAPRSGTRHRTDPTTC